MYPVLQEFTKRSVVEMKTPWTATVLSLMPEMFPGPLGTSLSGRALQDQRWRLDCIDIRDFALDRHKSVDDTPAGGGAGMVLRADIVGAAIDDTRHKAPEGPLVYMSPRGRPLTQTRVREFAGEAGVTILCGRFEGVDQRVLDARNVEEVSIGDYVLSGGELAAMVVIDAVVRLLPGVVGSTASLMSESHENGLLEYPQYTRPRSWEGHEIPQVLLSGDHGRIEKWRREQSEELTKKRRPDLWKKFKE
jgi:tRNA (guanine37-N1)-methyltransferase